MSEIPHETQWAVYENNVQAYRGAFNTSQSVLLALGALVFDALNFWLLVALAALAIFLIWWVWVDAINSRTYIVDYHKIFVDPKYKIPEGDDMIPESDYSGNRRKRLAFNKAAGLDRNLRTTRFKMDRVLPLVYSGLWVTLVILALPEPYLY